MKQFLLAFVITAALFAQQTPAPQPQQAVQEIDESERIRLDVTRVNVLYTVSDKRGRFVTDLDKEQFDVFEGKHKQQILEFMRESDLPLRLAILIDTSNSIRDRFRFQQEAAVEFMKSVMRPEQDKAVIVGFDTSPEMLSDLTGNMDDLEKAVRDMRPGGGTALYDAIFLACRDKLGQDQPRHKYRRAMIVLTDGEDTQSRYTRDQALEMAHKADVVIYGISTNITRIQTDGDKVLKYFAAETGGLTFFPFKVEDLAQSFENIANEMRHQYSVLYRPEPLRADGQYHEVNIRVKNRRDYTVRARKGYYAPKFN